MKRAERIVLGTNTLAEKKKKSSLLLPPHRALTCMQKGKRTGSTEREERQRQAGGSTSDSAHVDKTTTFPSELLPRRAFVCGRDSLACRVFRLFEYIPLFFSFCSCLAAARASPFYSLALARQWHQQYSSPSRSLGARPPHNLNALKCDACFLLFAVLFQKG